MLSHYPLLGFHCGRISGTLRVERVGGCTETELLMVVSPLSLTGTFIPPSLCPGNAVWSSLLMKTYPSQRGKQRDVTRPNLSPSHPLLSTHQPSFSGNLIPAQPHLPLFKITPQISQELLASLMVVSYGCGTATPGEFVYRTLMEREGGLGCLFELH